LRKTEPVQEGIGNILDVRKKVVKIIELLDQNSKKSEENTK